MHWIKKEFYLHKKNKKGKFITQIKNKMGIFMGVIKVNLIFHAEIKPQDPLVNSSTNKE